MTPVIAQVAASVVATDEAGQLLARELIPLLPTAATACLIGACGRETCDAFTDVAAECGAAGAAFFVVELGPKKLRISPVYGREYGSCYHCRAEAIRAARSPFDHAEPVPAGWLPQQRTFAAAAVADVLAHLAHPDELPRVHRILDLSDSTLSSMPSEGMTHA